VIATDAVHGTVAMSVVRCYSGDLGAARRNTTDTSIGVSLDTSDGPARERHFWTTSVGAKTASDDRVIRV
jgi:hypothetical protein